MADETPARKPRATTTPAKPRARKQPVTKTAGAKTAVAKAPATPNVVLCGFVGLKEFTKPAIVEHRRERVIAVGGRLYEYTGDDAEGRRIYRDMR